MLFSKISIIIPVYNAEKTIRACVDAVLHQDASGIEMEVIAVDDGSIDTTSDILKTFERVIYVRQPNAGPAAARNRGAKLAGGEILFFTDADCIPRSDWIRRVIACFDAEKIDVAAGSYGIANPESRLARCVHQEILYRHEHLMGEWIDVFGSYNAAVRKEVFDRLGGFDENYRFPSGEDNDLSYRLRQAGVRIRFVKEAKVDHAHPVSVRRYLYEQFRHGLWRVKMYRAFPDRMKGDGYTFWKDPCEVFLTMCFMGLLVLGLFQPVAVSAAAVLAAGWFGLEVFFAWLFHLPTLKDMLFFAGVMFLRSWARTAGFFMGMIYPQMTEHVEK